MLAREIVQGGFPLTVLLLTELPDTNDVSKWARVPLLEYVALTATPRILSNVDNVLGMMELMCDIELARPCTCQAFGVLYDAYPVLVGPCSPIQMAGKMLLRFSVSFIISPWEE